jgi:hypothetical protein
MRGWVTKTVLVLVGGSAAASLASAFLWAAGSAVVMDRNGQVVSAVVTNEAGTEQRLYRLPGGNFYVIPEMEGTIEIQCRDGSKHQGGYVTGNLHTWLRVDPGSGCGKVVEV